MNSSRGKHETTANVADIRASLKLNFEITARRLVAPDISDAMRCASDIRERIVSFCAYVFSLWIAGDCAHDRIWQFFTAFVSFVSQYIVAQPNYIDLH